MEQLSTLDFALDQLVGVISTIEDGQMELETDCHPWSIRQLASHAVNSQLLWVSILTGEPTVSVEDTMSAVAYEADDLVSIAEDAAMRARTTWGAPGLLDAIHSTPFGELPGRAIINFPTIDASAHAWDIASALGRPIEFPAESISALAHVIEAACNEQTRAMGLFASPSEAPTDATETERLMAAAGRAIRS